LQFNRIKEILTAFPCSAILSAKCAINIGISSRLSFSEGTLIKIAIDGINLHGNDPSAISVLDLCWLQQQHEHLL
jgi:hypothetical protein